MNRTLIRWGNSRQRFSRLWFSLGVCASLILLPIAIVLVLISLFQNLFKTDSIKSLIIEPVVPGINLPASEIGYYGFSLILCSIVHEIGHALAAVREDVTVNHLAVIIIFCLPIAYANINTDKLFSLQSWQILRILCAGIWHNLVLSFVAFLVYISLPYVFSSCFEVGNGVTISTIAKHSPLRGSKGLFVGDVVVRINDCLITDENSWYDCLNNLQQYKPAFCVDSDLIHSLDESIPLKHVENDNFDCCDQKRSSNLCFEYLDTADGILELPTHACLPARTIIEKSSNFCTFPPNTCPGNLFCFRPLLVNNTNLFKIIRRDKPNVVYIGLVTDLYRTIEVSSYIPEYLFKTTDLPDIVTKYCKYVIIFSLGLAIINIIPCMFFDGQHIIGILVQIVCGRKEISHLFTNIITWIFTILIIIHCGYFLGKQIVL